MKATTLERLIWAAFAAGILAVVVFGAVSLRRSSSTSAGLPVLGTVPAFSLVERSGRTVTRADLDGQPWVANFIFTQCGGVCPVLSTRMGQLQRALAEKGMSNVRSVSFSVDPAHDTPQVLRAYAEQHHADANRWLFLTGPRGELYRLISEGFRLAVAERSSEEATQAPGELITHSDRFVLVDASGRLRAYYHGTDSAAVQQILQDLPTL
jgi:cytochrome oxidase Cu insertion factor (SCO1/SenC/PrrC family)